MVITKLLETRNHYEATVLKMKVSKAGAQMATSAVKSLVLPIDCIQKIYFLWIRLPSTTLDNSLIRT